MFGAPHVAVSRIDRRSFFQGAGVCIALPLLDAMMPRFGRAAMAGATAKPPKRLVAIQTSQGIMPELFFPKGAGSDYTASPYLEVLKDFKKDFTVFSGVSHPGVDGGHANEMSFLTAAQHPASGGFRNTISLDQYAADRIGVHTRFRSLVLGVASRHAASMSFTESGVIIPGEQSPSGLYKQLFVQGDEREIAARLADLREGRSLLDSVRDSAKSLDAMLGTADRRRLDQYLTSIRELEGQLAKAAEWESLPKPKTDVPMPEDITDTARLIEKVGELLKVVQLALQTDSTRVVSLFVETLGVLSGISGVKTETHALTHHGNRPEMIQELQQIETGQFRVLSDFLTGLAGAKDETGSLLDQTMVLYGTCMGNANGHTNTNWPVLLAGGGFAHRGHLEFNREQNYPLGNLFVSMLRQLGIETDRFATGTGIMSGVEPN
jgi:hypothetical protein